MPVPITASILYDLVHCPHRVSQDLFGNPNERDAVSAFVQLLWERGSVYEQELIAGLDVPLLDLSAHKGEENERLSEAAMARGEALIYSGRIRAQDLLGVPDLLRREAGGYVPGDIKSGSGEEGDADHGRPKKHYAMQLALYVDILEHKGLSAGRRGFVWDVHGQEVVYDLTAPQGARKPRSLWDEYQACLATARAIVARATATRPAYASACKLCHWYSACLRRMKAADDLTLIPELGRSKRDAMASRLSTIHELAASEPAAFVRGKATVFRGIGPETLFKFQRRARLLDDPDGRPYLKEPLVLPQAELEIFFDIEVDPMRDICYLHGFIERHGGDNRSERYIPFFADAPTPDAEARAFAAAWRYLEGVGAGIIYYYSKYERTLWRRLRERYPDVCSEAEIEKLFAPARAIDLYYDIVLPKTEWPVRDYSIKTLAKYLGFSWRDTEPSGAASIEWYHRWVQSGDPAIRQRILEYNEDDCRATRVLLDGLRKLPVIS